MRSACVIALVIGMGIGIGGAQAPTPAAHFDVASIKSNRSGDRLTRFDAQVGGRLVVYNATLTYLVLQAYRIQPYQLVGGLQWMADEHFDIDAKADGVSSNQLPDMLRTLLEDRFRLVAHTDTRDAAAYSLVRLPNSAYERYMHLNDADCSAPVETGKMRPCESSTSPGGVLGRGMTMAMLASSLSRWADRPILDKTELQGRFDFRLLWTPDTATGNIPPNPDRPPLVTAVQEQLGLKLEPSRELINVIVIDRVERPTQN